MKVYSGAVVCRHNTDWWTLANFFFFLSPTNVHCTLYKALWGRNKSVEYTNVSVVLTKNTSRRRERESERERGMKNGLWFFRSKVTLCPRKPDTKSRKSHMETHLMHSLHGDIDEGEWEEERERERNKNKGPEGFLRIAIAINYLVIDFGIKWLESSLSSFVKWQLNSTLHPSCPQWCFCSQLDSLLYI